MNMTEENIAIQTLQPPLEDMALIETYKKRLKNEGIEWKDIGIFVDKDIHSTLILLIQESCINAVMRFVLPSNEGEEGLQSKEAIDLLLPEGGKVVLRNYQSSCFSKTDVRDIDVITSLWDSSTCSNVELDENNVLEFFYKVETETRETGRGKDFSVETKRKVMQDSHGRCMFDGCGVDLGFDELTGEEGNFSYLAHNIASSEKSARSIPVASRLLSDNPQNVLLLCDKHHRLVDKVAKSDYPAERLAAMRSNFISIVKKLLDGVAYQPIPVYSVLWPVQRNTISAPSPLQISQCLAVTKQRIDSSLNDLSDNEAMLRDLSPSLIKPLMPGIINSVADKLLMQLHSHRYRSALFAFGPMSALIALGAKLGNKNEIMPMLRYRDGGQWCWPIEAPNRHFFDIKGMEQLGNDETEIVIQISLTAKPPQFEQLSNSKNTSGIKTVEVTVKEAERLGNGAIGHPIEGMAFTRGMHSLLLDLSSNHGVQQVHLLPCASNAACVFLGQAFDTNHPEIIVYDFEDRALVPFLKLKNEEQRCKVSGVGS
ncbi:SAVED domain-containing protein [Neptuniibacter sp. QD37_11]|uniref:SAVED domain-containing protein n=1 Tax=Neptuniibacter sp. QD37_11 TaxID=3398209 RepID=UPI0039F484E0